MNKQEPGGPLPPDPTNGTATAPDSLEQQLEKERQARVLMRDRLRHTEALAAESHALRSAMAQELEKVTADRDRLRAEASTSGAPATASADSAATPSFGASASPVEPSMTFVPPTTPPAASTIGERPLAPPARRGPWRALAMLGGLAAGVAFLAWLNGSMPSVTELASTPRATSPDTAKPEVAVARTESAAASVALAAVAPASATVASSPTGAVPLPPLAPEAQLAAAPTAAGPAPSAPAITPAVAPAVAQVDLAPRLRKALDGEGISAPVAVDAASGHVVVSDPRPDPALRDRTDMLIRAVYAGASLPEPQIEHRWLTPKRGEQVTSMSPITSAPASAAASAPASALSPAAAYLARHPVATTNSTSPSTSTSTRAVDRARKPADLSVADAEELRPVLPAGRLTAACMDGLAGKTTARRAGLTTCMKHSCCSSAANLNSEECRAYTKAYPFTCSAG